MLRGTKQAKRTKAGWGKYSKHWSGFSSDGCIICGKVTAINSLYCVSCNNFGIKHKTNS